MIRVGWLLFLSLLVAWSTWADFPEGQAELIASGSSYAIHGFEGAIAGSSVETVLRPGLVISHTNLETGELKWLIPTGTSSLATRRISYSIRRLVGLLQNDDYLIAVVFDNGRIFTEDDKPPLAPIPSEGAYFLQILSKKSGRQVDYNIFVDHENLPQRVPAATIRSGVLEREKDGYRLFGVFFELDESGQMTFSPPEARHR